MIGLCLSAHHYRFTPYTIHSREGKRNSQDCLFSGKWLQYQRRQLLYYLHFSNLTEKTYFLLTTILVFLRRVSLSLLQSNDLSPVSVFLYVTGLMFRYQTLVSLCVLVRTVCACFICYRQTKIACYHKSCRREF